MGGPATGLAETSNDLRQKGFLNTDLQVMEMIDGLEEFLVHPDLKTVPFPPTHQLKELSLKVPIDIRPLIFSRGLYSDDYLSIMLWITSSNCAQRIWEESPNMVCLTCDVFGVSGLDHPGFPRGTKLPYVFLQGDDISVARRCNAINLTGFSPTAYNDWLEKAIPLCAKLYENVVWLRAGESVFDLIDRDATGFFIRDEFQGRIELLETIINSGKTYV